MPHGWEGPVEVYADGRRVLPGTPEADALARRVLTTLYELAAAAQGRRLDSIAITRWEEHDAKE